MGISRNISGNLVVLLIILFLAGCTTSKMLEKKYVGKTLPRTCFQSLNDSGHNTQKSQHFDIAYKYKIDHATKTIQISGVMKYNRSIAESKYQSETILLDVTMCEVIFLFGDKKGKILDVKGFFTKTGQNIFDPITFEMNIPFKQEYKLIRASYHVNWQGN